MWNRDDDSRRQDRSVAPGRVTGGGTRRGFQSAKEQHEDDDASEEEREGEESHVDLSVALRRDLAVVLIAIVLRHLRAERYPHRNPFSRVRR